MYVKRMDSDFFEDDVGFDSSPNIQESNQTFVELHELRAQLNQPPNLAPGLQPEMIRPGRCRKLLNVFLKGRPESIRELRSVHNSVTGIPKLSFSTPYSPALFGLSLMKKSISNGCVEFAAINAGEQLLMDAQRKKVLERLPSVPVFILVNYILCRRCELG